MQEQTGEKRKRAAAAHAESAGKVPFFDTVTALFAVLRHPRRRRFTASRRAVAVRLRE